MRRTSPFAVTPWVRGLLIANAVVYLLTVTLFTGPWVFEWFAFSPAHVAERWWSVVTHLFLHDGLVPLGINLLLLFVFGPAVEERMGGWFALYYLLCGLGGVVFAFVVALAQPAAPLAGASSAVLGVALAFAVSWPDHPLYLVPLPIPVAARWVVAALATLDLGLAALGAVPGVAHMAHVGGLVFGSVYLKSEEAVLRRARAALRRGEVPPDRATRRRTPRRGPPPAAPPAAPAQERELDRLLDKISARGLDSLTPEERRVLEEASRELREH